MSFIRYFSPLTALVARLRRRPREYSLDLLRGIAVFLMLLAHSVFFLYAGENGILRWAKLLGDTLCFGVFLFVSGSVVYLAYLRKPDQWENSKNRLLRRSLIILAGYYLVAIVAAIREFTFPISRQWLSLGWEILAWQKIAGFTEFLIPLVLFRLLLFPSRKICLFLLDKLHRLALFSVFVYWLGSVLYSWQVPSSLVAWKALLAGHEGWYTFPLLQYSPVFLLGILWGKWSSRQQGLVSKENKSLQAGLTLSAVVVLFFILLIIAPTAIPTYFSRWPPSLPFLIVGLALTFILLTISFLLQELSAAGWLVRAVLFLGEHAFPIFIIHSLLLQLFKVFELAKFNQPIIVLLGFLLLFVVSCLIAGVKMRIYRRLSQWYGLWRNEYFPKKRENILIRFTRRFVTRKDQKRRIKKRYLVLTFMVLFVLLSVVSLSDKYQEDEAIPWWSDEFAYYRNLSVKNTDLVNTHIKGTTVSFSFDHAALVGQGKALVNGNDVRVVYWDNGIYREIERSSQTEWNTRETVVNFDLQADLLPQITHSQYYLYYGNNLAGTSVISGEIGSVAKFVQVSGEAEVAHPIRGEVGQQWLLKGDGFTLTDSRLEYKVLVADSVEFKGKSVSVNYKILNTEYQGIMSPVGERAWQAMINFSELPVGDYQIQTRLVDEEDTYFSQKSGFYVSYPLYVVWSIDWEGYDASAPALEAISRISQKHELPITHFFNPRIYVNKDISPARSEFLTRWIKNRRDQLGDEIGMHLHMFHDFVEDAEVEIRREGKWGNWPDGYDVPMSIYNYEETMQLLERGKYWFSQKGLGNPVSFRAGGWFADADVLRAVQTAGFYLDSSGRDWYVWGPNKITGYWDLSSTTRPYQPAAGNQNRTGFDAIDLWEFPNNGGSSYDLLLEELIHRFTDNFSNNQSLTVKQTLTYLSHPQWFSSAEQERVDSLFSYLDKFKYDDNWGPVRYVTLEQAYQAWGE
ncbi:acyltransferase family protein [Patescibacteria group bacterium]|nr:acyltransferase family protein [Patescibacteria group bacterium]MBU1868419.1 acyltransferase family protein [Patescibacteria group bacterium]